MPVLFPIGIQFSAFLFAQKTTVFNKLEGTSHSLPPAFPFEKKKKIVLQEKRKL